MPFFNQLKKVTGSVTNLNEILGPEFVEKVSVSSGNADDTVVLKFNQKDILVRWGNIGLDAQAKNTLGEKRLESGKGVLSYNIFKVDNLKDNYGFLGASKHDHVEITSQKLSFTETSIGFKQKATIYASEETPSIIRSLSFTKKAGTNYPLISGDIDFTRKDGIFSGKDSSDFWISGIETLFITFDKRNF